MQTSTSIAKFFGRLLASTNIKAGFPVHARVAYGHDGAAERRFSRIPLRFGSYDAQEIAAKTILTAKIREFNFACDNNGNASQDFHWGDTAYFCTSITQQRSRDRTVDAAAGRIGHT
jgi:hypothetical protein